MAPSYFLSINLTQGEGVGGSQSMKRSIVFFNRTINLSDRKPVTVSIVLFSLTGSFMLIVSRPKMNHEEHYKESTFWVHFHLNK